MRIKFLSFIASFFMVSFVITSCLDDDNNIEYSPDATIHAFELDTIGYGKTYKFTIDQIKGEIYNEDSLPVGADTIIDRILIKTLSTASGIVSMRTKDGKNDSLININDSIDLREPIKIKVWSTEAYAGVAPEKVKEYTIEVRVHNQDPDSLNWVRMESLPKSLTGIAKSVIFEDKILVYNKGELIEGVIDAVSSVSWSTNDVTGLPGEITSIVNLQGQGLYATVNNTIYHSELASGWTEIPDLGKNVKTLLAAFPDSITAIVEDENSEDHFCKSDGVTAWVKKDIVPTIFSQNDIVSAVYTSSTGIKTAILVGTPNAADMYTVPWFSSIKDKTWYDMTVTAGTDTSYPACPYITNPSVIHYNNAFYIFGGNFSTIHKSLDGRVWQAADNKFCLPKEFKEKPDHSYTMVKDEKDFIWIIWNDGEVWRGRLNKLGFDKK